MRRARLLIRWATPAFSFFVLPCLALLLLPGSRPEERESRVIVGVRRLSSVLLLSLS